MTCLRQGPGHVLEVEMAGAVVRPPIRVVALDDALAEDEDGCLLHMESGLVRLCT